MTAQLSVLAITGCPDVPLGKTVEQKINAETVKTIYLCKSAVNLSREDSEALYASLSAS